MGEVGGGRGTPGQVGLPVLFRSKEGKFVTAPVRRDDLQHGQRHWHCRLKGLQAHHTRQRRSTGDGISSRYGLLCCLDTHRDLFSTTILLRAKLQFLDIVVTAIQLWFGCERSAPTRAAAARQGKKRYLPMLPLLLLLVSTKLGRNAFCLPGISRLKDFVPHRTASSRAVNFVLRNMFTMELPTTDGTV